MKYNIVQYNIIYCIVSQQGRSNATSPYRAGVQAIPPEKSWSSEPHTTDLAEKLGPWSSRYEISTNFLPKIDWTVKPCPQKCIVKKGHLKLHYQPTKRLDTSTSPVWLDWLPAYSLTQCFNQCLLVKLF